MALSDAVFLHTKNSDRIFNGVKQPKGFYHPTQTVSSNASTKITCNETARNALSPQDERTKNDWNTFDLKSHVDRLKQLKEEDFYEQTEETWDCTNEGVVAVPETYRPRENHQQVVDFGASLVQKHNRPEMSKLIESFRTAPARSRKERGLEKQLRIGKTSSFSDKAERSQDVFKDKRTKAEEDGTSLNVELLNQRIEELLSASASLSLSISSTPKEQPLNTSVQKDTSHTTADLLEKLAQAKHKGGKDGTLRKEDDILYQWRLRRKIENAKHPVTNTGHFSTVSYDKRKDSLTRQSVNQNRGGVVTPAEKPFIEDYTVERDRQVNVSLTEIRSKLKAQQQRNTPVTNSHIVGAVSDTLSQNPLFRDESRDIKSPLRTLDFSCQTEACSDVASLRRETDAKTEKCGVVDPIITNGKPEKCGVVDPIVTNGKPENTAIDNRTHKPRKEDSTNSTSTQSNHVVPPPLPPINYFPPYPMHHHPSIHPYYLHPNTQMPIVYPPYLSQQPNPSFPNPGCVLNLGEPFSHPSVSFPTETGVSYEDSNLRKGEQVPHPPVHVKKSDDANLRTPRGPKRRSSRGVSSSNVIISSFDSSITCVSSLDTTLQPEDSLIAKESSEPLTIKSRVCTNDQSLQLSDTNITQPQHRQAHTSINKCSKSEEIPPDVTKPTLVSVPKERADALMWCRADKLPSTPRFKSADLKLHVAKPVQCNLVPAARVLNATELEAEECEPIAVRVNDNLTEIATSSVTSEKTLTPAETPKYSEDFEEITEELTTSLQVSTASEFNEKLRSNSKQTRSKNEKKNRSSIAEYKDMSTQISHEDLNLSKEVGVNYSFTCTLSDACVQTMDTGNEAEFQCEIETGITTNFIEVTDKEEEVDDDISDGEVERILEESRLDSSSESEDAVQTVSDNLVENYRHICAEKERLEGMMRLLLKK